MATKQPITRENFTAALHAAVESKGRDYTYAYLDGETYNYSTCEYFYKNGRGRCIIGAALYRLGYRKDDLGGNGPADTMLSHLGVQDEKLTRAARRAQIEQDNRGTWGVAEDTFLSCLETVPRN